MGGNEGRCGERRVGEAGDGSHAQHEGKDERRGAVSADLAVAHDLELALRRPARAEAVRGVGQTVLMQAAGDQKRGRDGENPAHEGMETERMHQPVDERAEGAHAGADDRERPACADNLVPRGRCRTEQAAGASRRLGRS